MLDFVYIIKEDEKNEDLRYSLRSIAYYYPNNRVWIVGYKPSWVQNVKYLPVKQNLETKWKNSINNVIKICENTEISDDFILMNDDFFVIKPTLSLEKVSNCNLGLLENTIKKSTGKTQWYKAFPLVYDLLKELNIPEPYFDYEAHLPLEINKKKFLEIIYSDEVIQFTKTSNILHYRTLYKNYNKTNESIVLKNDVKLNHLKDDSLEKLKICGWLSVSDDQVKNSRFRDLNAIFNLNFYNPCKYETEYSNNIASVLVDNIKIPQNIKKDNNFINY